MGVCSDRRLIFLRSFELDSDSSLVIVMDAGHNSDHVVFISKNIGMVGVIHKSEFLKTVRILAGIDSNIEDGITYKGNKISSGERALINKNLGWVIGILVFWLQPNLYSQEENYFKIGDWRSYFFAGEYTYVVNAGEDVHVATQFRWC